MSAKSKIEWTDATWNPVIGCTKVSAGCKHCYAERQWPRLTKLVPEYSGRGFTDVSMILDRLDQPLHWKRPRLVFVNSMSDLFHEAVDQRFIADVFGIMAACPQHTFQILTKRPARALKLLGQGCMGSFQDDVEECMALYTDAPLVWPLPNVWLGVSIEDQATAGERIPMLLDTPAAVRWISAEPLLGEVNIKPWLQQKMFGPRAMNGNAYINSHETNRLDWVVAGGESGPKARPMNPHWVRSLRDQCAAADVPFLFKQWGEYLPITSADTPNGLTFWPDDGSETGRLEGLNAKAVEAHGREYARVGKKAAGRLLDGVQHGCYPEGNQ